MRFVLGIAYLVRLEKYRQLSAVERLMAAIRMLNTKDIKVIILKLKKKELCSRHNAMLDMVLRSIGNTVSRCMHLIECTLSIYLLVSSKPQEQLPLFYAVSLRFKRIFTPLNFVFRH